MILMSNSRLTAQRCFQLASRTGATTSREIFAWKSTLTRHPRPKQIGLHSTRVKSGHLRQRQLKEMSMSRNSQREILTIAAFCFGITFLAISVESRADSGSLHVDLIAFCQKHGFQGVTHGNNGYSWKCTPVNSYNIDVNLACREQHGSNSRAYLINEPPGGIYDWRCTGAAQVNVTCYCKVAINCSSMPGTPEYDWFRTVGGAAPLTQPALRDACYRSYKRGEDGGVCRCDNPALFRGHE